jgi:AcrR family transcriptional regulator/DNA-binding MarR family transcriptional regulator
MAAKRRQGSLTTQNGSSQVARGVRRAGDPRSAATTRIGHALVNDMQRSRLLAAAVSAVGEHGWEGASIERITQHAGVSRRTFYDLFKDREACLVAVLEGAVARITRELQAAELKGLSWSERVRSGLWVILCFFDREPGLARVCLVESRRGDHVALRYRQQIIQSLVEIVEEGRRESSRDQDAAGGLVAQGVVGGVSEVLYSLLLNTRDVPAGEQPSGSLSGLLGQLMGMIVLPYMGAAAARREQSRPLPALALESTNPQEVQPSAGERGDLLVGLPMRLTYRTARVLQTLAEHPGQSNRQVGELVGIPDQGQTSKLLARLARLGLLVNGEPLKGERNKWVLTPMGNRVTRSIQSYALSTNTERQATS